MKKATLCAPLFMILFIGFSHMAIGQEYTYLLTVNSLNGTEQSFSIEINSKLDTSAEPTTIVLSNQTTPFERILKAGAHVVVVNQKEEGLVLSKITGIVDGETKGSASSDDKIATLKAGPGGRYSAGLKVR